MVTWSVLLWIRLQDVPVFHGQHVRSVHHNAMKEMNNTTCLTSHHWCACVSMGGGSRSRQSRLQKERQGTRGRSLQTRWENPNDSGLFFFTFRETSQMPHRCSSIMSQYKTCFLFLKFMFLVRCWKCDRYNETVSQSAECMESDPGIRLCYLWRRRGLC